MFLVLPVLEGTSQEVNWRICWELLLEEITPRTLDPPFENNPIISIVSSGMKL